MKMSCAKELLVSLSSTSLVLPLFELQGALQQQLKNPQRNEKYHASALFSLRLAQCIMKLKLKIKDSKVISKTYIYSIYFMSEQADKKLKLKICKFSGDFFINRFLQFIILSFAHDDLEC